MNKVIDKRYKKLKKIYKSLIKNGLISEGEIINYDEIIRDLYYINLLLFKTYKIFSESKTKKIKIDKISKLTDPNGNRLFNKKTAKKIVEIYGRKFVNLIDKIKRNRIKMVSKKQQMGGKIDYKNNNIEPLLKELSQNKDLHMSVGKLAKSVFKLKNASGIDIDDLTSLGKDIITRTSQVGPDIILGTGEYIFNWVFFPLYQLENLPLVGFMFEIPLDIMGIVLDNSDVLMEFIAPLIPLGMDLATDSVALIPGVGSGAAAVGLGMSFLEEPIEWLFADGLDMVGLYINIQRKQWGLAYLSAMEVFPQLPSMVDMVVTNMYTANKHLGKVTRLTRIVKDTTELGVTLSGPFLTNPMLMFEPQNIWEKVIYPNREIIPIVNKIPFEKLEKIAPLIATAYDTFEQGKKTIEELTDKFLEQKKVMEDIAKTKK